MSLIVHPYIRNLQTGEMLDIVEKANVPFNDIFGYESWRRFANVYATTVVHNKNLLGRTYMFFVEPMHKLIVPAVLRTLI